MGRKESNQTNKQTNLHECLKTMSWWELYKYTEGKKFSNILLGLMWFLIS